MSYSKRITDPSGGNVWENLPRLSKQPSHTELVSRNLSDADRRFVESVVVMNDKHYDRIRDELVGVIERLSGEGFRNG